MEAPVVSCGDDITVEAPRGSTGISVTFPPCTGVDNSGTTFLLSQSHQSGQLFQFGTTTVTFLFSDPSGLVGQGSFNITVNEGEDREATLFHHLKVIYIDLMRP